MSTLDWFPTRQAMWRLPRQDRAHRPDEINLKSCELLQPRVHEWIRERMSELSTSDVVSYPLCESTRRAVAEHFERGPDEVLLSPGTDHAIRVVAEGLCAPAGRLVIADPHYDSWSRYATQYGFQLDAVPTPPGAPLPVDALIDRMRGGGPAVVVLTQPDSITGQLYRRPEVVALARACQAHGSLLVLDTCYLAFAEDGAQTVAPVGSNRNVVRINSFSKSLGLAGARVGAVLADRTVMDYLARWCAEKMIGGFSLHLLRLALRDSDVFAAAWSEVRAARATLGQTLATGRPGWQPRPSEANFVAFDAPADAAATLYSALLSRGIRTRLLSGLPSFVGGIRIATPSLDVLRPVLAAVPPVPEEVRH